MQYRPYGKDGPLVSRLGFGAMRLPERRKGDWGSVNFTRSVAILRQAMQAGVNFLDSHHGYHEGLSEVAIGRALKGWKGQRICIQTKTPFYDDKPIDHFKRLLDKAIEKTGVDVIDYLLFHSMRRESFERRGRLFFKFTDWAIRTGRVRHRGFSSHDTPDNVRRLIDTGEFAAMVLSYNWQNPEMADTIAYGADKGMGVAIMNPIGGGLLAVNTPQILRLIPGARTGAEVALRYVIATRGVAVALSGMSTPEQVAENVQVASRRVPMTVVQRRTMKGRLESIARKARRLCTSCGYCMPCPNGVDIPHDFLLLNRVRFFGLLDYARKEFRRLRKHRGGDRSALACVRCGKCLPKCPARVPIIEQLRATAELLAD